MLRRFGTIAASAVFVAGVLLGQPAAAQVDLNGLWRVGVFVTDLSLTFADVCSLTIAQSGTSVSIAGSCAGIANPVNLSGSLDPQTGSFTASGSAGPCPSVALSGLAANSQAFTGTFSCPQFGASGGVNASRCGNGQIDPGESCDDGNLFDNDCCTANCRLTAAGGACADDGNPCTSDTCDGAGQCLHANRSGACNDGNACTSGDTCIAGQCLGTVQPDDTPCDDGNACTTGDRCVGGACVVHPVACPSCEACDVTKGCVPTISTGCREAPAGSLVLSRVASSAVTWKWQGGEATDRAAFGSPTATTDYDFCVYDGHLGPAGVPRLVAGAHAAAGRDWHAAARGFSYRSSAGRGGVKRIRLTSGAAGQSRIIVKGRGSTRALPPLETLKMPVDEQLGVLLDDLVQLGIDRNTVILITSDNGVGWGEHRLFVQGKALPYEECLRVPMIVRDGRRGNAGVYDAAVATVDIAPTVAELARVVPPVPTDGTSFASWITGSPPAHCRDAVLIEHWRSSRNDGVKYTGQVTDGDQVRILYGDTRQQPRPSVLFEFDAGGGVTPGAVAVPIGADATASFTSLGAAVAAAVPYTAPFHLTANNALTIVDKSPDHSGVYFLIERDQGAVMPHTYDAGDWFGVRDVVRGLTYVEHESGEVELYDLNVDPAQLENKATDPAYAATRQSLALQLDDLLR